MRPPAKIHNWLSLDKMFRWLRQAPDEASYKRRMAIWLTHTGQLHAPKVAQILNVSTQAVRLWIAQYNSKGPEALLRRGRGGKRWSYLNPAEEAEILKPFMRKVRAGQNPKPASLKPLVEQKLGKKVSMPYIYKLLSRHHWARQIAQSHSPAKPQQISGEFKDISRPWLREF